MEKALQKAKESGYKYHIANTVSLYACTLQPSFWQALGKSLGWVEMYSEAEGGRIETWPDYWHGFIDHLAEGKDAESFFNELLK